MRYPPLRYYLEKVLRDRAGISHWAAKALNLEKAVAASVRKRGKGPHPHTNLSVSLRKRPVLIT